MLRLMLIVVDGRQPNYSEGVSLAELAQIVRGTCLASRRIQQGRGQGFERLAHVALDLDQ